MGRDPIKPKSARDRDRSFETGHALHQSYMLSAITLIAAR